MSKLNYFAFARPKDALIVHELNKIENMTTSELNNFLKINTDEEFLAIHTPYCLESLNSNSHPFKDYKNVIRKSKPESKYSRPDYYIAILPSNEFDRKKLIIYVDVEVLNPKRNQEEEKEMIIPPFPLSLSVNEISNYAELKQTILKNFPF